MRVRRWVPGCESCGAVEPAYVLAVGAEDRSDRANQRRMGVADQEVSARHDYDGPRLAAVRTPAGEVGKGHEGVAVAAADMDRAG
jgi:hypothetical protein